jgi:hypothetical protein
MYLIMHETSLANCLNILRVETLLKSSKIQELGLTSSQGSPKRKLSKDPKVSLRDANFSNQYDEVDGVYFRLLTPNTPIRTNYGGDCVLIFSKEILNNNKFIINTEENFGFCIAEDGIISEAQFSGEKGMTITTLKNFEFLKEYQFNPYSSEILILDSVNLKELRYVFVKNQLKNDKLVEELAYKNIEFVWF